MDRKESIKTMLLGSVSLSFLGIERKQNEEYTGSTNLTGQPMRSNWSEWPDMEWVGPDFWGNRLQDWQLRDGKARCSVSGHERTLHCLTYWLGKDQEKFTTSVNVKLLNQSESTEDFVGFRLGAKSGDNPVPVSFSDYRRSAVFGEGLHAGIQTDGRLFIGTRRSRKSIDLSRPVTLRFSAKPIGSSYSAILTVFSSEDRENNTEEDEILDQLTTSDIDAESLAGNLALVSHFSSGQDQAESPSVLFSDWRISGNKVHSNPEQTFGPICFAQYTLDRGILKMTAQLAPVEAIKRHSVALQIRRNGQWKTVQQTQVDPLSRTAHFRQNGWDHTEDTPYRLRLELPLPGKSRNFYYEGTIATEPNSSEQLKMAVFSCNSHYGFPNQEVVDNVKKNKPDIAVFLGDQLYESHGGFGVQHAPVEKAALDWLRKWYMFGWSYRDIIRHIPSAFIPDDHDVYHGNIWGEGGKKAPVEKGWGYDSQDAGGYKMPPEWVNMVHRAQTGHLPDPYDPVPVKQGINVYYTDWNYGGISFAIIEDRKFKTAPKSVLPKKAKVVNGFIQNRDFDIKKYYDIDAELLGLRQIRFLEHWVADWSSGAQMKAVLSQTNFCALATLPEGSILDQIVPKLPIPEKGSYVSGDAPTTDMDSNGWPQKGRDEALRTIRKGFALHIAGDQHLASVVQYGVEEYGDAGFAFAGPALNNIWPRRWWPPVGPDHKPLPQRSMYTGDFEDGFGNKMTVHAVANPAQTNRKPGIIYDRATGYGIVTFDKVERKMTIECWPRYVDPATNSPDGGQYDGWPVVIEQQANYGREAAAYLPRIIVEGMENPVIEVHNVSSGELEYALRINGQTFRPKVFEVTSHKIRVGDPDRNEWYEFEKVNPGDSEPIICNFKQ